jgi:hypothetical protein
MEIMELIVFANILVCMVTCGIGIFIGLDLKKWSSWLYGLYGFLSGFTISIIIGDVLAGLKIGFLTAFVVMFCGAMSRWHRQHLM